MVGGRFGIADAAIQPALAANLLQPDRQFHECEKSLIHFQRSHYGKS
jgi:hypothetical protein